MKQLILNVCMKILINNKLQMIDVILFLLM